MSNGVVHDECRWAKYAQGQTRYYFIAVRGFACSNVSLTDCIASSGGTDYLTVDVTLSGSGDGTGTVRYFRRQFPSPGSTKDYTFLQMKVNGQNIGAQQEDDMSLTNWWNNLSSDQKCS